MATKSLRIGIIYDGTDQRGDAVAVRESGVKREQTRVWQEHGFDDIYILSGVTYDFCSDKVKCRGNQLGDFQKAIQDILVFGQGQPTSSFWKNAEVEIITQGHGGGNGKEHSFGTMSLSDFMETLRKIPSDAQRVIKLGECHAASIIEYPSAIDDNDLLLAYAGREEAGHALHNFTDGAELGFLGADAPLASHQQMFFRGLAMMQGESPFANRGFVFLKGNAFVDRGVVGDASPDIFPRGVVAVNNWFDFIQTLSRSYEKGITVIGFASDRSSSGEQKKVLEKYKELAKKYPGWVQFIWVDQKIAKKMETASGIPHHPFFLFHFPGADSSQVLSLSEAEIMLSDVLRGKSMQR